MYQALAPYAQMQPNVRRSDLTPLSDTQRSHIAPQVPYPRADVPTNGTQHGMVQSPAAVQPRASNKGVVFVMAGLGLLATIGLVGIGAALMAKKPAHAQASSSTNAPPPSAVTTNEAPPTVAPPSTQTAAALVAPPERTVKVAVPANATVDVDGQKHDVVDGNIALTGALGSVQKVHVVANGAEVTQTVAITEGGAIPPKVIVAATGTVSPTGKAGTKPAGGSGTGGAKPTPSGTGTTLNVQRNFE